MPGLSYLKAGLVLKRGERRATRQQVKDLQRDLRRLGYLRSGIDGGFGPGTELAVKALQHDLLNNAGRSTRRDGAATVRVLDYNRGRVDDVTGRVDKDLADCIADMLDDPKFPKLPFSENPREENRKIVAQLAALNSKKVPIPFLLAIMKQESNLKHFRQPRGRDEDNYIIVGLDTNAGKKYIITSRGYGLGQYTLFHHPPRREEVRDFIIDPKGNLQKAIGELREKFDHFVIGKSSGTRADDRLVEIGKGPLRVCKYKPGDKRYMKDCAQCLRDAGMRQIRSGVTPFHKGTSRTYQPTQYYKTGDYSNVPIRKNVGCDWPYAVRRYNGSGINSYHYQARVLRHLLSLEKA